MRCDLFIYRYNIGIHIMHAVLFAVCNSSQKFSGTVYKAMEYVGSCYFYANAKLRAGSKSFTIFFTALMSMSISFPVFDEMTMQLLLSSMYGRNSLAFSADENKATLAKGREVAEP